MTTSPAPSRTAPSARDASVTLTVTLAILGVFIAYLPIGGVMVGLSDIGRATGASTSGLQWVSDAYVIPMAASIVTAGAFGDIHGRKRVFALGMALTAIGATISAIASTLDGSTSLHVLWGGQAVTGAGGGILLPTTLALIGHAVPEARARAQYLGLWAAGLLTSLALGPIADGAILGSRSFGWIFAPLAAIAALATVVAVRRLPESRSPEQRRLDWPGQLLAALTIAASIFGVIQGGKDGFGSTSAVAGLVVAGVGLLAFLAAEMTVEHPAVDLAMFRSLPFSVSGFAAMASLFSVVGTFFVFSLFFGKVQHHTPLEIGLRLACMSVPALAMSLVVGRILRRVGPQVLLTAGLAGLTAATVLLSNVDASVGYGAVGWRLALLGISVACVLSTTPLIAVSALPHAKAGMAATTNTVLRQFGAALAPAILGVIVAHHVKAGGSFIGGIQAAMLVCAAVCGTAAASALVATLVHAVAARRTAAHGRVAEAHS